MESLFKSIAIGVFVGVAGALFLYIFSEYITDQNEALVFGVFAGIAFPIVDLIAKKALLKSPYVKRYKTHQFQCN